MWKRDRARRAKVHAGGAQMNREFREISREYEGCLKIKEKTREPEPTRLVTDVGGLRPKNGKNPKSVELPRPSAMDGTEERKS